MPSKTLQMPTTTTDSTDAALPLRPHLLEYAAAESPIRAFSTEREGGYSLGAYGEFNVNPFCGDQPDHVQRNKQLLCEALRLQAPERLLLPHQVHGTAVYAVAASFFSHNAEAQSRLLDGVDAVMTNQKGICVGVSTADCVPLLIYDPEHATVCAVHSGWRGTVAHIAVRAINAMTARYGSRPSQLRVVIGPAISQAAFEVGDEVYDAFARAQFDMSMIARRQVALACRQAQGESHILQDRSSIAQDDSRTMQEGNRILQASDSNAQELCRSMQASNRIIQADGGIAQESCRQAQDEQTKKWHIDLFAANTALLLAAGLELRHIRVSGICTYANVHRFFSTRRLGTKSGRIYSGIMLK